MEHQQVDFEVEGATLPPAKKNIDKWIYYTPFFDIEYCLLHS